MYKRFLAAVLMAVIVVSVAGCSPFNTENTPKAAPTDAPVPPFRNEADFQTAILEARGKKAAGEKMNGDFTALAETTEYYRPKNPIEGLSLDRITFSEHYVSFRYRDEDGIGRVAFIWARTKSPGTWRYEPGHTAVVKAVQELNHNGTGYVLTEYDDLETDNSAGVSLRWNGDGIAFVIFADPGYTVEELLAFSEYETVLVDAELDH